MDGTPQWKRPPLYAAKISWRGKSSICTVQLGTSTKINRKQSLQKSLVYRFQGSEAWIKDDCSILKHMLKGAMSRRSVGC